MIDDSSSYKANKITNIYIYKKKSDSVSCMFS